VSDLVQFTIFGLVLAAIYAVAASGLVVTYTTTGIFNFAHGAIGMIGAFAYWQLRVGWKWPVIPAVIVVLVVVGPAMGVFIDRVIMRGLEGVSEVTKVVVSIGLLFGLISLAPIIWNPKRAYSVEPFFGANKIEIAGAGVTYHQLTAIVIAVLVAVGLRAFLYGTRSGVAMRAVVDNRALARLNGARPTRSSSMSWALGCSLAALSGILVAERLGLEVIALTFLVVNAYAAAVVGRLTSLSLTFLGAVILGLTQSYAQGYINQNPSWMPDGIDIATPLRLAIPVLFLFITLLLLPNAPLRTHGLPRSRERAPKPTWRLALVGFAVLIAVVSIVSGVLGEGDLVGWRRGLAIAIIMLSLVPLTGYGGQISLAQMTFAGIGAFTAARMGADGSIVGIVAAVVVTGAVGALVALPALRLRGIYLALATLAFAYFVEKVVFTQRAFVGSGSKPLTRLAVGPVSFAGGRSYMILLAVVFSLVGVAVVAIRLGPFGRRLQAMKDSPAACATLGLNLTVTKMQVFILSAAIAGLGGAMLAGVQTQAQVDDFGALQNLPVLLMAVAGGIALVSGALFGGLLYASFAIIAKHLPTFEIFGLDGKVVVADLLLLAPALIGISLGRNPNGAVNDISSRVRAAIERSRLPREQRTIAPSPDSLAQTIDLETLGIDRPFTADDLALVDKALAFDEDLVAVARPGATASWSGAETTSWAYQTGLAEERS
jgi:branched-chain amino acid transport system permease protein